MHSHRMRSSREGGSKVSGCRMTSSSDRSDGGHLGRRTAPRVWWAFRGEVLHGSRGLAGIPGGGSAWLQGSGGHSGGRFCMAPGGWRAFRGEVLHGSKGPVDIPGGGSAWLQGAGGHSGGRFCMAPRVWWASLSLVLFLFCCGWGPRDQKKANRIKEPSGPCRGARGSLGGCCFGRAGILGGVAQRLTELTNRPPYPIRRCPA
jgi:hypothetical protein